MDVKKVNLYLAKYGKHYSSFRHAALREALMQVPDEYFDDVASTSLLNPTYMQVASVWGGIFGIDRFLLGDKKMGFVKLFLLGGCGVIAIIDMFKIQKKVKSKNFKTIMKSIAAVSDMPVYQAPVAPMPVNPMYAQQPYAPVAPMAPMAPVAAPVAPKAPVADPVAPEVPKAPVVAQTPVAPAAPAYVVPAAPVVTAPAAKPAQEKATPVATAPKAEEKVEEPKIPDIAPTPIKK